MSATTLDAKTQVSAVVSDALQQALVNLTDLSLQAKQAHWNLQGPQFRSLHLFLDEIVDLARTGSDDVAERLVTIGGTPDGRADTIAATTELPAIEFGVVSTDEAYKQFDERLNLVSDNIKKTLDAVDAEDHLSNDLLIGIATGLEKQAWMLRASIA